MEWYRAWVGACSDEKITEAKLVSELPRSVLIALWHALLESACRDEAEGAYSATPRRLAAVLEEPVARIEAGLAAFAEVGLIRDGAVVAWAKRQTFSYTPSSVAERQRRHREKLRQRSETSAEAAKNAEGVTRVTPVTDRHVTSRRVTPPDSETETELSSSSSRERGREIDLGSVRPIGRDPLEAEARLLMDGAPVVVDVDFSPISALLAEPGVTRADVLAGLADARAAPNFRPVSWRQCQGWVRRAAKMRLGITLDAGSPGRARPPPHSARPPSALSVCLEIARGDERNRLFDDENPGAAAARSGFGRDARAL
jgi:hypothetical protein